MASRLPTEVLLKIFSYLSEFRDLCNCSRVCRRWRSMLNDDSDLWEGLLRSLCPAEFFEHRFLKQLPNFKAKLVAYCCTWNDEDSSKNIYIKKDKLALHRNPVSLSSDAIRGKKGFVRGMHYWIVVWHGPKFGSTAVVGIATKHAKLQDNGYYPLIGCDKESWGWDIPDGKLRHGGEVVQKYPTQIDCKVRHAMCLWCSHHPSPCTRIFMCK